VACRTASIDVSGFHWENCDWVSMEARMSATSPPFSRPWHERHRFQLQRLSEAGEPGGRSAQSGPQRSIAIFGSIALSTSLYLMLKSPFSAQCLRSACTRMGGAGIQLAIANSPCAEPELACHPFVCRCLREPERTGVTYTATTARMIYAMERTARRRGIRAVIRVRHTASGDVFNIIVSFIFLFFFAVGQARGQ